VEHRVKLGRTETSIIPWMTSVVLRRVRNCLTIIIIIIIIMHVLIYMKGKEEYIEAETS